jgi:hypothetical protein
VVAFPTPEAPTESGRLFKIEQRRCKHGSHRWLSQIGDSFALNFAMAICKHRTIKKGGDDVRSGVITRSGGDVPTKQ